MTVSLYEGRRRTDPRPLIALFIANGLFAAVSIVWWTAISFIVAEPLRWATWQAIGPSPELFDYPFVLLWLLPLGGVGAAWLALRLERRALAYFLALYPMLFIAAVVGWFYLAPPGWR